MKRYPDFWLRIIASLVFSHMVETLGREESLAEQWLRSNYWSALFSGWLIAFVVWTLISIVTHRLDQRFDWLQKSVQRIALQILLGVIIPGVLLLLLTWIQVRLLWDQDIIENGFHLVEFPFILLILVLVNVSYFAWYLFNRMRDIESKPLSPSVEEPKNNRYLTVLMVNTGNMQVPVPVNTIHYIAKQGDYSLIKTPEREFVSSVSLDALEGSLDPNVFFRANRQVIITFSSCRGIKNLEYGKLEVRTEPTLDEPLIISQKKARAFRDWLANR